MAEAQPAAAAVAMIPADSAEEASMLHQALLESAAMAKPASASAAAAAVDLTNQFESNAALLIQIRSSTPAPVSIALSFQKSLALGTWRCSSEPF